MLTTRKAPGMGYSSTRRARLRRDLPWVTPWESSSWGGFLPWEGPVVSMYGEREWEEAELLLFGAICSRFGLAPPGQSSSEKVSTFSPKKQLFAQCGEALLWKTPSRTTAAPYLTRSSRFHPPETCTTTPPPPAHGRSAVPYLRRSPQPHPSLPTPSLLFGGF